MHWGIFVGVNTIASIIGFLLLLVIVLILLYVVFCTQVGLFLLIGLIIYGLYRLFRKH